MLIATHRRHRNQGVILIGAGGCGKGTQADMLMAAYQGTKLSLGDRIRQKLKDDKMFRMQWGDHIKASRLLPDEVVLALMQEEARRLQIINKTDLGIIAIDGFCRSPRQVNMLRNLVSAEETLVCFDIRANQETIEARAALRQREDDKDIVRRFKMWEDARMGIIHKMGRKGIKIIPVEGSLDREQTFEFISNELESTIRSVRGGGATLVAPPKRPVHREPVSQHLHDQGGA